MKTAPCDLNWHWKSWPEEERWESELHSLTFLTLFWQTGVTVFRPAALLDRFQTMKVWKNLNIYKIIYIALVVACNLLSFKDFVVVSWQNLIRLSLRFTFVGFGAIFFSSPALGLCQKGGQLHPSFPLCINPPSREPGEHAVAWIWHGWPPGLTPELVQYMWSKVPVTSLGWNPRHHPVIMRKCHTYLEEEDKETVTLSIHCSLLKIICNAAAEVQDVRFGIWTWCGGAL